MNKLLHNKICRDSYNVKLNQIFYKDKHDKMYNLLEKLHF